MPGGARRTRGYGTNYAWCSFSVRDFTVFGGALSKRMPRSKVMDHAMKAARG